MLVTEDDCSGRSNSENREGIDGAIRVLARKFLKRGGGFEIKACLWF